MEGVRANAQKNVVFIVYVATKWLKAVRKKLSETAREISYLLWMHAGSKLVTEKHC